LQKLVEAGAEVEVDDDKITVAMNGRPRPITVVTEPFPGFPTDLQPPMGAFLARCDGVSLIVETIHRDRLLYWEELEKLGAKARIEVADNPKHLPCLAWVFGIPEFHGNEVTAPDLRAGAALLLAGLSADGETIIHQAEKIQRGYSHIVEKLSSLGAEVDMLTEETVRVSDHVGTKFGY
jgi:UDP-N-acetylglucosamine 1-carboxyvinyltransferase